jgi:hypothetical protein
MVVLNPFGLTVLFKVAPLLVTRVAACVVAVGALALVEVVNVKSLPSPVPPLLVATIRKW